MNFRLLALALSLMITVASARSPGRSFELIAYGIASSYIKLFYSDGLVYAGDSSLWTYGEVTTNVTFVLRDTKLITTATTPGVTLDPDTLLYIRPATDKVLPVGFTGNGDTTPSDAACDGFIRYGPYLMWESDNSLSDSFRMKVTNVSGVYQVYWDTSNLYPSGYLLPIVKILHV